ERPIHRLDGAAPADRRIARRQEHRVVGDELEQPGDVLRGHRIAPGAHQVETAILVVHMANCSKFCGMVASRTALDAPDARLLELLQHDCSRSLAELGAAVGLSVSAVNERLKKLRARGHVRAYVALIDPRAAGYGTCAFVQLRVDGKANERRLLAALAA